MIIGRDSTGESQGRKLDREMREEKKLGDEGIRTLTIAADQKACRGRKKLAASSETNVAGRQGRG